MSGDEDVGRHGFDCSHHLRERSVDLLRGMVAAGRLLADALEVALERVLTARSEVELATVIRSLPAPVALTPPSRRLAEPLRLRAGTRGRQLRGRWQLATRTSVRGARRTAGRYVGLGQALHYSMPPEAAATCTAPRRASGSVCGARAERVAARAVA